MPEQTEKFESWGIVELLGHRKLAGKVSEATIGGASLIRIDVPETKQEGDTFTKPYTKYVGPGSIYCITPCTEAIARTAAERLERWHNPIPVDMPVPKMLAAGRADESEADWRDADDEGDSNAPA